MAIHWQKDNDPETCQSLWCQATQFKAGQARHRQKFVATRGHLLPILLDHRLHVQPHSHLHRRGYNARKTQKDEREFQLNEKHERQILGHGPETHWRCNQCWERNSSCELGDRRVEVESTKAWESKYGRRFCQLKHRHGSKVCPWEDLQSREEGSWAWEATGRVQREKR